ncbi:MAG: TonB-dependent receptor [Gammaproteobacteria bacterium]|nr:TonB-dependent receptor [Gammaproteobacteria bacterium]
MSIFGFRRGASLMRAVTTLTPGVLILSGAPALAQEGTAGTLEEIIVTAQKREEALQEIPIAITAFSTRELETQRVSNVLDLLNKVPSVSLTPFVGTRAAPSLFIRGMGSTNIQSTKDLATGVYIDGVPLGRAVGLATDIADLERVEVLRGPQGTLWGRNTTAGAISFITQKPDDKLSFGAQLTAGSWDLRSARVKLNVPLTDKLFARASYTRSENDGWVKNLNTTLPNQINFNEDRRKEALRLALRYEPVEHVTVDYGYDSSKMIFGNHFYQIVSGPAAVAGRQESVNRARGLYPSDTEVSGHNLTIAWDLGAATVRSISAYRELDSQTNMNYIDAFTQDNAQGQHQVSQELQLVGNALHDRLKYATGLFFFEEKSRENVATRFAGGLLVDSFLVQSKSTSAAVYGQATWTPPVLEDRLGVTLGLRYTEDSRKATKTYVRTDLGGGSPGLVIVGDRDFHSLNPALTLDYAFAPSVNAYAKYSTGYRAGGFSTQSSPQRMAAGYEPEDVKAWEVGVKSDLLEKRLRVNLAAFRNKYTDLQVDQGRTPNVDVVNAASATVKGAELESAAILARGLTANLFYSWLKGEYQTYTVDGVDLLSQRRMPLVPRYQFGVGLEYAFPHAAIGNFVLNVDYRKQDKFYSGPQPDTLTAGYGVWNARLQLADIPAGTGSFRVAVWGKNLSDEVYRFATTNFGVYSAYFGAPRSVGVDAIYEF